MGSHSAGEKASPESDLSMGKIGVIVKFEHDESANREEVEKVGKKIAMHIAAAAQKYMSSDSVPEADVNREKEILTDQIGEAKSEKIARGIVQGRLKKFYEQ